MEQLLQGQEGKTFGVYEYNLTKDLYDDTKGMSSRIVCVLRKRIPAPCVTLPRILYMSTTLKSLTNFLNEIRFWAATTMDRLPGFSIIGESV